MTRRTGPAPQRGALRGRARTGAALLLAAALTGAGCTGGGERKSPPDGVPALNTSLPPAPPGRHALGAKWNYQLTEKYVPYLRSMSGGASWYEVVWCEIEPEPGRRDWAKVDAIAGQARQLGFELFLKLRVGSCWATGGRGQHVRGTREKTESLMPQDLGAYEQFVSDAVRRYSPQGIHSYAVENEINGESMWGASPQDYVRLAELAAAVIRREDRQAVVVDPGISSTAYGHGIARQLLDQGREQEALAAYAAYYERRFPRRRELPRAGSVEELRAALDTEQARRNLDYLAVARDLAQRRVVDVRQLHFYEKWTNVPALMAYLRTQLPPGMPVGGWEVGMFWPEGGGDEPERTDEVVRTVEGLLGAGVRDIIWLPLAFDPDEPGEEELRYSLLGEQGEPREAGRRLLEIADATRTKA